MKILLAVLFTLCLLTNVVVAQNGDFTAEDLQKNNAETVRLFQEKKYDEALPLAQKSVEMAKKLFGDKHIETAAAIRSVGYLYYLKGDLENAEAILKEAFDVYEKLPNLSREDGILVAKMLEVIATIRYSKKISDGEKYFQLALEWREKYNGKNSPETLTALSALANIKYWGKDYKQAAELFRQVLEISAKDPKIDKADTQLAYYRCECAYRKSGKSDEFETVRKKYDSGSGATRVAGTKSDENSMPVRVATDDQKTISGGVVNGKAFSLPPPRYPAAARAAGARGVVKVQVLIDEDGNIISACTINDVNSYLAEASETAAYQARFRPTQLEGKPVKVLGVITYVFN